MMSLEDYVAIIDCVGDPIIVKDCRRRLRFMNDAACEMLSIPRESRERWLGKTDYDLVAKEQADVFRTHDERVLETGEKDVNEERIDDGQGGFRTLVTTKTLYTDKAGEKYIVAAMRDITERKRAEEAFFESEAKYRTLVENSRAGVYIHQDNLFRFVNKRWCEIYGYSEEEVVDILGPLDVTHPEDRRIVEENMAERRAGEGEDVRSVHRCIRKDGTTIIVDVLGSPMTYRGRWAASGTVYDMTEYEKAQEELREKSALLRAQMNASLDGIIVGDRGKKTLQNQRVNDLFKIPRRIAEGDDDEEQIVWIRSQVKDPEQFDRMIAHVSAYPNETIRDELELKDGTILDRYSGPVADEDLKGYGRIWTFRDITARKRSEEALRASQLRLSDAMDLAKIAYWESDPIDDRFIFNDPFYALYGTTAEREGGYFMTSEEYAERFVHPDDLPIFRQSADRTLAKADAPSVLDLEHRIVRRDGEVRHILVRVRMVKNVEGLVVKVYGSNQDVTERKRLESQLHQSQKMEAIGTLAGGIAHDFNNILTALVGYAALLKMKVREASQLAYVDQILIASQKATDLVQSLLAFSKQQPIRPRPMSIRALIKGTEKLLKRLLTEDIAIKTNLAAEDITVMADRSQIDQILFNLATNARDAMPQGGTLLIETQAVELSEEFHRLHGYGEPGRYALLAVSDTGVGMDEATRERIFDPFFTTKEIGKGTGLGLSTVYGIVKQHNGYITVYSEPNRGAAFRIYLPAVDEIGKEEQSVPSPLRGGSETILVAEDNETVRGLVSHLLRQYGYTTVEAIDGGDAVEQFSKAGKIDLLIFDTVMPKKNGPEAYEAIRAIKPDVKVIFTSGYTRDVFLDKGVEDGKVNFLQKPVSLSALLTKVREALDAGPPVVS